MDEAGSGRLVAVYRRHIYEIIEEFSDSLYWTTAVGLTVVGSFMASGNLLVLLLLLLPLYEWVKFIVEYARWRAETFTIVEGDNGKYFLTKESGLFNTRSFTDEVGRLTIETRQDMLGRILKMERVTMSGYERYLHGNKMPVTFSAQIKRLQRSTGASSVRKSADGTLMGDVLALRQSADFVGRDIAQRKARELVEGM